MRESQAAELPESWNRHVNFRIIRTLMGPNIHGPKPMIEAEVTFANKPANLRGAFEAAIHYLESLKPAHIDANLAGLPDLPSPNIGSAGHLISCVAILLQRWAGLPLHGLAVSVANDDQAGEIFAYEHRLPQYGIAAGQAAAMLYAHVLDESNPEKQLRATRAIDDFIKNFTEHTLVAYYVRAAEARGVPWRQIFEGTPFMGFGQGRHQHKIWQNFTEQTSHIATVFSTRKHMAGSLFRSHGLPVPRQFVVADVEAAVRAAHQLGFPVVVKPAAKDFGTAVNADLRNDKDVRGAFAIAEKHGPVLVEEFIPGFQHRLTVLNGRVASVRRHKPAHVIGDGHNNIRALVDAKNRLPHYKLIELDDETLFVLRKSGKNHESVPALGEEVILRTQANLHAGGTLEIVTDITHPDNARLAIRAAAIMGIDIAGLDFITTDISRSHLDVGGAICEINVTPAFRFYEEAQLMADWYPSGQDGRVPVIVFLDSSDDEIARALGRALHTLYPIVTLTTRDGVYLNEERIVAGDQSNFRGSHMALFEPSSSAAVLEYSSRIFIERGAPFDRCNVLVVPREPSSEQQAVIDALTHIAGRVIVETDRSDVIEGVINALGAKPL